ncbi:MAG TPA: aminoglycoside phosphotransferase family protein [Anaerolineales bacterium]|nr:aminoglycoside phosphotransferase family protein [Anaerolineales bacterium]
MFNGGTGPFPENIIMEVEGLLPCLFAESGTLRLIHGDLHHFNILSSERGWLAIDPKGIIGPAAYEVGPLLINPWGDIQKISQLAERRIAILSERLGFTRKSLRDWALCHSVLSAWWGIKPDGSGGEYSLACAEIFSQIRG